MGQFVHDTIEPSSTVDAEGFTVVSAASLWEATSDLSDSSYAKKTATGSTGMLLGLTNPTALPAFAQIVGIRVTARVNRPNPPTVPGIDFVFPGYRTAAGLQTSFLAPTPTPATITNFVGPVWATKTDGTRWTLADIDALNFWLRCPGDNGNADTSRARIYQLSVEVLINRAPTATPLTPNGVLTTTTKPVYVWTYADADGDAQEQVRVKLFSGSGAVTDPEIETTRLLWDSGPIFTGGNNVLQPFPLEASASYRWASKAADAGSNGSYGPWNQVGFSTSITPPPAPTATTAVNTAQARIDVHPVAGAGGAT
ncbi:MAG TPA: hypothetical protein VF244_01640, partial [Acidimicrobiales bacterium]